MELTRQQRIRFGLLSVLIIGVLFAQTVSGFRKTYKWWPFLAYPMYAEAHFEGERIKVNHRIYAVTSDGVRHYLDPEAQLKLGFWRYDGLARWLVAGRLRDTAGMLAIIKSLYPTIQKIEVEDFPMIITRNGPAPAPRKIVAVVSRASIDELTK